MLRKANWSWHNTHWNWLCIGKFESLGVLASYADACAKLDSSSRPGSHWIFQYGWRPAGKHPGPTSKKLVGAMRCQHSVKGTGRSVHLKRSNFSCIPGETVTNYLVTIHAPLLSRIGSDPWWFRFGHNTEPCPGHTHEEDRMLLLVKFNSGVFCIEIGAPRCLHYHRKRCVYTERLRKDRKRVSREVRRFQWVSQHGQSYSCYVHHPAPPA